MSDQKCDTTCPCFREALIDIKPFTYCSALGQPLKKGTMCVIDTALRNDNNMKDVVSMLK